MTAQLCAKKSQYNVDACGSNSTVYDQASPKSRRNELKIRSLPPQFVHEISTSHESRRDSSRQSSREPSHESSRERQRARDSDQSSSEPQSREKRKSEGDSASKRDDDSSRRTPLRLASVTTADLAAALSPEGLGLLNFTDSQPSQTRLNKTKKSDESDPVAEVLKRLALLAEADRRKRSLALAAYAKVRDALKPEPLPEVELLQSLTGEAFELHQGSLNDESDSLNGVLSNSLSGALDNALDLNELDHLNLFEPFGIESSKTHAVASHPNGITAHAAFTHIDLAA